MFYDFLHKNAKLFIDLFFLYSQLNVHTGQEVEYLFPEGMYVQEPQFIPTPGAVQEDDGVIIAQGVDGRKHKGKQHF